MCIKTTYHNTYSDGTRDRTERVESCSPGFLCSNPIPDKVYRNFNCTKAELDMGFKSYTTDDRRGRPVTPRSISPPGSRGSDTERKHRRRTSIYRSDPVTISKPYVPQPPSPIPIQRSSTMTYGVASPPLRGRDTPLIITDPAPRYKSSSATIPIGPVEVLEHASPRRRPSRRDSSGVYLSPDLRRHSRSPQGYASAEDERERAERRRRRRENKNISSKFSSSVPTPYINDGFSSSYGSSHTSDLVDPSPAATAVNKKLRWEDTERAKQNARISSRPKLSRSETLRMSAAQGEVKSILKNSNSTSTSPAGRTRASSSARDEQMDELYRSMEGLGISERETSAQRRAREEKEMADQEQKDRLSRRFDLGPDRRFSMPPRSYTMGSGGRRRQEIFYPDQRTYRTQW